MIVGTIKDERCVYVCVYIDVCICTTDVCMYGYMHTWYVSMFLCMHEFINVYMYDRCMYRCMYTCIIVIRMIM